MTHSGTVSKPVTGRRSVIPERNDGAELFSGLADWEGLKRYKIFFFFIRYSKLFLLIFSIMLCIDS
jgi:hypothetical protein